MSDADIQRTAPPELENLPDSFWDNAVVVVPKQAISLRIDEDVLTWFKQAGPKYQTRMNAVLRAYVRRHAAAPERPAVQHWSMPRAHVTVRERIETGRDKRFVRRGAAGKFRESDDVGRSLTAEPKKRRAAAARRPGRRRAAGRKK